jgi:hypothetical protein
MDNFNKNIDKLVFKILNEEVVNKVRKLTESKGLWTEIETKEGLKGGQKKIDVAEPKGKITSADFKKLRGNKMNKKEVDEFYFYDDEELLKQEPTVVKGLSRKNPGKMFGSFNDEHGFYDEDDRQFTGDFDFDYDEEEFDNFDDFDSKYGGKQSMFARGDEGRKYFDKYKSMFKSPFRVRTRRMEEAETKEGLKGGQKKIDVAEPKGKITSADFKKLRGNKMNKKEVDEFYFYDDEELLKQEPTVVKGLSRKNPGKMFGSFNDEHGFYDEDDRQFTGDFDFDYDEEEFDNFDDFDSKYGGKQSMFARGDEGRKYFDKYKSMFKSPFRVRTRRMEEAETKEGNALANAKKSDKDSFEVDGKTYNVRKESRKSSLRLTEDELIDMIEKIVLEQKVKDTAESANISKKSPVGLKKTEDVLGKNKKENDDYAKEVVEKMKDYMKDMFSGSNGYDENPDDFPQSNYDMEKDHKEKKYHPSDAVEEYIEAFAYPGMTNLVYDEIKPDDEMIEKQIKGDSKNGNAVTSKDGKALGNVSKRSEKVGERFKKNFDDNLYGAEQQKGSYKRQTQPVDVAGDKRQSGGLKNSSAGKAQKIMNQLESAEDKKSKVISEEMNKMKNLIGYNRKTQ